MTRTVAHRGLRIALAATALAAALGVASPALAQSQPSTEVPEAKGRVLVVSMPGVTWDQVRRSTVPNLYGLLEDAAVADLAPRGVRPRSGPGDAYLTISSGSRADTEPSTDGQVLFVDEQSTGTAAGDIYTRRTGQAPEGPFVSLAWPAIVRANDARPYDTQPGLLASTLAEAAISRAVIGNGDGTDSIGPSYERQAGLALADQTGALAGGALGKDLLVPDPAKPYGVELDHDRVVAAFEKEWAAAAPGNPLADKRPSAGGVVLVEASDLARVLRYRPLVDFSRFRTLWAEALTDSDVLLGRLLESVGPNDTVLVLSPYNRAGDRDLGVVALTGPDVEAGYLQSASTQRAGFLTLVDIAPTILDRLDVSRPVDMEGRPALVETSSRSTAGRIDHLIALNDQSRFREQLLTPTTTVVVVGLAALLAATIVAHANRWGGRARTVVAVAALTVLGVMPASYLARLFPIESEGTSFYWTFVYLFSIALAVVATVVARLTRHPRAALLVVLGVMGGVLVGDVVTGSNLSLSAAFGYSPTGNSRLYGISNYSYGQLATAACLLAAWLAFRIEGRRGKAAALATMVGTLVVLGVPIWGSDVGGILSFTPTIVVFAVVLARKRIRLRTIAIGAAGTAIAILAFGFLDLARPAGERSHLGRLFERVGTEGLAPLFDLIERKLLANLAVSSSSMWVAAIPVAAVFFAFLRWFPDRPYRQIEARFTTLDAGIAGVFVAGLLGSALNDSGAIIGGVAAAVCAGSLAFLLMEPGFAPSTTSDESDPVEPVVGPAVEAGIGPVDVASTGIG